MKRVALVTGANRGIGFEVCRQLAEQEFEVILTSRNEEKGQTAAYSLQQQGLDIQFHRLDVTDLESVAAVQEFVDGRLAVLVNNAGVYLDGGSSILDMSLDTFRTTMEINFYGALHMCRAFVPLMQRNNYGRVVNVSSGYSSITEPGSGVPSYRISKVALNALTRIVANEVRGYNIKVNTMCPGWVSTEMGGSTAPVTPAEAADTIIWLATLPDDGPTNGFFRERRAIPW